MPDSKPLGRPARISREDIADAALKIGLHQVTLKGIAQQLGVDHSSLYRHVKGRGDILHAAADRAIANLDWSTDYDDWRTFLEATAEAVWALYARYPGLADTIRLMERTPPAGIRAFARACNRLEDLGFSGLDAALVMDSIMDMTLDSASGWERLLREDKPGHTPSDTMFAAWLAETDEQTARQVQLMTAVIQGDPKHWWRKKLALLINGAQVILEASQG